MRATLHEKLSRQEEVDLVESGTRLSSLTWKLQGRSANVLSNNGEHTAALIAVPGMRRRDAMDAEFLEVRRDDKRRLPLPERAHA